MNTSSYHRQYLDKVLFFKKFDSNQVFPKLPTAQTKLAFPSTTSSLFVSLVIFIVVTHINLKTSTTSVIGGSSHG